MSGAGRNERCRCGSLRKYKHCCLEADQRASSSGATTIVVVDQATVWIRDAVNADPSVYHNAVARVEELRQAFVDQIGAGFEGREAAEAIQGYLDQVETTFGEVAGQRSRFWWIYLVRRLPPRPIGEDSGWTIRLFRTTLWLGALKHASDDDQVIGEDHARFEDGVGGLMPDRLDADEVTALYTLEQLAYEFNAAAVAYRRVGKGAVLRAGDGDFDTPADDTIEELIQLNDVRAEHYRLFSPWGSAAGTGSGREDPLHWMVVPDLNVEGDSGGPALARLGLKGRANYLPGSLSFAELRTTLGLFAEQVEDELSVQPDEIFGYLWSVALYQLLRMEGDPRVAHQVTGRGYMVVVGAQRVTNTLRGVADGYRVWVERVHARNLSLDDAEAEVTDIHRRLLADDRRLRSISLWDRMPMPYVLADGDLVVWDLSAVPEYLRSAMRLVGRGDGAIGNVRAANFETEVGAIITEAGLTVWKQGKRLVNTLGADREVDLGIVVGDTLVVVECKAFSANPRIDRGDFAALRDRWSSLERYLEQARTLTEFLRRNRSGRNYEVPAEVLQFEYCLCTALPEHIPSSDPDLWIAKGLPRVMTPSELVAWIRPPDPSEGTNQTARAPGWRAGLSRRGTRRA